MGETPEEPGKAGSPMIRGEEFGGKAGVPWRHGGYKVVQKNKVPVGKPCL